MIFPLPYSSYVSSIGQPTLSTHSRLVLLAALTYLQGNQTETVALIAEKTFGSKQHLTAVLMQEFLLAHGVEQARIKVHLQTANNTYQQLRVLKSLVGQKQVTLIAFEFHAQRVKVIAKNLKLNATVLSVENLLKSNVMARQEVDELNNSKAMRLNKFKENWLLTLARLDKFGLMSKIFSTLLGPRKPLA